MKRHGIPDRAPSRRSLASSSITPLSKSTAPPDPGLFGRMFPNLPALDVPDAALLALAKAMKDPEPTELPGPGNKPGPRSNPSVPAGFTYLGQFIDHDITLDLTSLGDKSQDPEARVNFRTPSLDLDSVYGHGPDGSPHMYSRAVQRTVDGKFSSKTGPKLRIGTAAESDNPLGGSKIPELKDHDLPRLPATGVALLGDPRNDENLLVAQTHVAFMRFHNTVVDRLIAEGIPEDKVFTEARKQTIWHYQWIVLHEFLEKLTGEAGIADRIIANGRQFYTFQSRPYMPVEFSGAAYRLGHSMVREVYSHNAIFRPGGIPATLDLLFRFTAKSGEIVGESLPPGSPLPQPVLPSNWVIDWRRFFDFGTPNTEPKFEFNFAMALDPFLTKALHTLPGEDAASSRNVLAFRNLKRGVDLGLPSGQSIARAIGVTPLTVAQVSSGPDGAVAAANNLAAETPLWYYILKEAEQAGGAAGAGKGRFLGPVGATIVSEVFVGLVQGSRTSYLSESPAFRPRFGATLGEFTMVDLLTVSGTINPVGEL